ncbi:site-specific DNA-methyltransferase [Clostridium sp. JN-9]|uniref:site-specific DNA-methyltransferase n=1 Tax=Clostridium sp. JN-9 TaxID=2507159 RepID=UPI000FFDF9B2|nr:site-specific DNA-methyltransferase [Clostridium sp. JN-9]QAT39311.1 site-specific DNA-methyltransferase [Clostridium sp. JN-9]
MENKVTKEIFNPIDENIKKLESLFPGIVKDGQVDFEALKQELGQFEGTGKEKYELTWPGKTQAKQLANIDIVGKTLKYVPEDSKNPETTKNLYIEGDNLEVLKLLRNSYYEKVKMIYIDPPYNTGNDFVYKDNFTMEVTENEKIEGNIDEEGNRLIKNQAGSGRFHSNWLNMMYPRLKIAKDLLKDDGVIFISIDDNEVQNLRKICDDIFDENNFIANIVRNTNSSKNQSLFVSVSHDYCLIYAKNINVLQVKHAENKWSVPKNNINEYLKKVRELESMGLSKDEITEELKQLTKYPRFVDFTNYWYFDERGLYRKGDLGGVKNGNMERIFNPITNSYDPIPPGGFRYSKEKMDELIKDNRIHFHDDGSLPVIKRYLHENMKQRPKSIMSDDQRPDYSLLKEFNTPFDNPKQLAFMKRIISVSDKDAIVLDFFSGSATTAHAVMELNIEEMANRKFIMVQTDEEKCSEGSEAYKAGYKNICEIGKERIRRAGEKINQDLKDKEGIENIDIGFKVFKVADTNINWKDNSFERIEDLYTKGLSKDALDFNPGFTDIDVVYEIMLRHRDFPLTSKIENLSNIGERTYIFADAVVVCLEEKITNKIVDGIAAIEPKPIKVIFRDSAFDDDISLKLNTMNRLDAQLKKHNQGKEQSYRVEFI